MKPIFQRVRAAILRSMNDCPECIRLKERFLTAVDQLIGASDRLATVAGNGNHHLFERLLVASRAAKSECGRIRTEREQHQADHGEPHSSSFTSSKRKASWSTPAATGPIRFKLPRQPAIAPSDGNHDP